MARIRTIKPEFFTDAKILRLTPLARLFYVSLWCEADKQGRLKWDPETLKYRYLPADKAKVADLAEELVNCRLVRLYEIAGQVYADIPGFVKHQVINNRESESSLPAYIDDACVTRESGDSDAACGKEGREGKEGKEGTTPVVPRGDEYSKEFEDFWKVYPTRGEARNPKPPAWRAWKKALERGGKPEEITEAAKRYARTDVAGTKFCAQAATWLNQDDWKQQLPAPETAAAQPGNASDETWKSRMRLWKTKEMWSLSAGPRPGESGCQVPKHILEWADLEFMPKGCDRRPPDPLSTLEAG